MTLPLPYNNFVGGLWDERLKGRFDLPLYMKALEIADNINVSTSGGAYRRTGFELIGRTDSDNFVREEEFTFNSEQSYVLLFSLGVIEFLTYDVNGYLGFIPDGGGRYQVAHTYTLEEIKDLQFAQKDDVLYICHKDHPPAKLTRTSATTFTLADVVITNSPFDDPLTGTVGYPRAVAFYEGRLYYGGATLQYTRIWGTLAGAYDNFTGLGTALDADDPVEFDVADISEPILWLLGAQTSLFGGTNQGLVVMNGGGINQPITPTSIYAKLSNNEGCYKSIPAVKDNDVLYIENTQRRLRGVRYDLISENFRSTDLSSQNYDNTLGGLEQILYVKSNDNLIYTINNGDLLVLNLNNEEGVLAWTRYKTEGNYESIGRITRLDGSHDLIVIVYLDGKRYIQRLTDTPDFSKRESVFTGDVDVDIDTYKRIQAEEVKQYNYLDNSLCLSYLYDFTITYDDSAKTITSSDAVFSSDDIGNRIVYKTKTGLEFGVFKITRFTSSTVVEVEMLTETVTDYVYDSWYLSFNKISGLTEYEGKTVDVLGDGGFVNTYTVSDGTVELGKEITVACVGYRYKSIMKSFPVGFDTVSQQNPKVIAGAKIRFYKSAGVQFGTTLYRMEDIQRRTPEGNYDTPAILMDTDEKVDYSDTFEMEKNFYISQILPLPFYISLAVFFADGSVEA